MAVFFPNVLAITSTLRLSRSGGVDLCTWTIVLFGLRNRAILAPSQSAHGWQPVRSYLSSLLTWARGRWKLNLALNILTQARTMVDKERQWYLATMVMLFFVESGARERKRCRISGGRWCCSWQKLHTKKRHQEDNSQSDNLLPWKYCVKRYASCVAVYTGHCGNEQNDCCPTLQLSMESFQRMQYLWPLCICGGEGITLNDSGTWC